MAMTSLVTDTRVYLRPMQIAQLLYRQTNKLASSIANVNMLHIFTHMIHITNVTPDTVTCATLLRR